MATFSRFDICEAHYMYACLWHGGMSSKEYAKFTVLSRIGFKPAPSLDVESLTENGREIYDDLVAKHQISE